VGTVVDVHYKPSNPAVSLLQPGVDREAQSYLVAASFMMAVVAGFLAGGIYNLVWMWRVANEHRSVVLSRN
jgi:hypothetical protein